MNGIQEYVKSVGEDFLYRSAVEIVSNPDDMTYLDETKTPVMSGLIKVVNKAGLSSFVAERFVMINVLHEWVRVIDDVEIMQKQEKS